MYGLLISKNLNSMAIIQELEYKQRLRILFSKLPRNLFELYCREQHKQNVQINPTILIKDATLGSGSGGIDWYRSTLGHPFWYDVAWSIIKKREMEEDVQCIIKDAKKFIDFREFR